MFDFDMTVLQARQYIMQFRDDGVNCPCCNRLVKVYRRKLNSGMARVLIAQWKAVGQGWAHTARLPGVIALGTAGREGAKPAHWGLIENDGRKREDGGKPHNWRLTNQGVLFVNNVITVPSHAWIVAPNTLLELDSHKMVNIREALGAHYDYDEMMKGI